MDFKCEMFKALEKEKRMADIRFLQQNQMCPVNEPHYKVRSISEKAKAQKLKGNYMGFTIVRYTENGQTVYNGFSFAHKIEADGVPLIVFSVAAFPADSANNISSLSPETGAAVVLGLGCVAAVFLAARSIVKRESKKQWTPFFTSLSDLMNYVYAIEVAANQNACPISTKERIKNEAKEMFSWI